MTETYSYVTDCNLEHVRGALKVKVLDTSAEIAAKQSRGGVISPKHRITAPFTPRVMTRNMWDLSVYFQHLPLRSSVPSFGSKRKKSADKLIISELRFSSG